MKKYVVIVLSLVLFFSTVFAAPVYDCKSENDIIPDSEESDVFWVCNDGLIPIKHRCPAGLIFDLLLLICNYGLNPDHEKVCKRNDWGGRDCLRGNLISFRERCPDGICN